MATLEGLPFDNRTLRELPVDESREPGTRQVRGACFSLVQPTPVDNPQLVAVSNEALALLGLDLGQVERPEFVECFSGNKLLPGAQPAAHCYCGYQFGYFSGQLGDGAAMYLGEVVHPTSGERWELQLKGAGLTPYSRQADGRKVLRSSIREFLASEAMHHLGIPTTRAASLVTSDTLVTRDIQYTGNPVQERATVISRLAPTFLRFGSFEIFKASDAQTGRQGPSAGLEGELLPQMVAFTIRSYFPAIWEQHGGEQGWEAEALRTEMVAAWFSEVCRRTGHLVALWQCVGWCHGVLNTDNMSILGLTIDYGPFGFLERYDPDHICNGSDDGGRYDYIHQPAICNWNCERLAEALCPLLPHGRARVGLSVFDDAFAQTYLSTMRRKLGLLKVADPGDDALVQDLLETMAQTGSDFTNTFRKLAEFPLPPPTGHPGTSSSTAVGPAAVEQAVGGDGNPSSSSSSGGGAGSSGAAAAEAGGEGAAAPALEDGGLLEWLVAAGASVEVMAKATGSRMPWSNLQMLLSLAGNNPALLHMLGASREILQQELARHKAAEKWRTLTPQAKAAEDRKQWISWLQRYASRLQLEAAAGLTAQQRVAAMNGTNPRLILRNWVAQEAIDAAENGDFELVRQLLEALKRPYDDEVAEGAAGQAAAAAAAGQAPAGAADMKVELGEGGGKGDGGQQQQQGGVCMLRRRFGGPAPSWAADLCVTCSS